MNLKLIGIALAVASVGLAQSKSEETSTPQFGVASVRLNKSPVLSEALLQFLPGGRFVATDIPLIRVIAVAWGLSLQSQRLTLAPGVRMPDEIYDIEAIPEKGAFPSGITTEARLLKMRLMIQALLEDRFRLKVRREPKEQPVYVLVIGKDGPKLDRSNFQEENCGDTSPNWISNPACHWLNGGHDGGLHGASVTIAQVVESLQNSTDRPAIFDKTGLTGYYNVQTEGWVPMTVDPLNPGSDPQRRDSNLDNADRPTLFNVFDKLGLRLEPQRAVIDMFVIEHIERPSDN